MDTDATFDLLSSPVRRNVIAVLHEAGRLTRAELTAALAEAVGDATGPDVEATSETTRRRLRIALHHNHLPRLADAGVVEYDADTVTATPSLDRLAQSVPPADVDATAALG